MTFIRATQLSEANMIKLHVFGPGFGLPDPSPFATKGHMLLKIAGLTYEPVRGDVRKAPKGKFPVLEDDGEIVPDSTFIRLHIERKYGFNFDAGLTREQSCIAWSVEKMLEDHLYWSVVRDRWLVQDNFDRGPAHFFDAAPALLRPLIRRKVQNIVRRNMHGQGMGRHSLEEMAVLTQHSVAALAGILGDKPYLMGDKPCGADATAFGFVNAAQCKLFNSAARDAVEQQPNLVAYNARMLQHYFPETATH
jgi:glutathione S-transferase